MVTIDFAQKLVRVLELQLLKQANYQPPVAGFEMVLLMPIDPNSWSDQRTLLLSVAGFERLSRWELTYQFLRALREGLTEEEYLSIFNLDFIEPEAPLVQRVQAYIAPLADGAHEVSIGLIGGVSPQFITVIKSTILEQLQVGKRYLAEPNFGYGEIIGVLTKIEPEQHDIWLHFDTADGERTCTYTDLVSLKKLSAIS